MIWLLRWLIWGPPKPPVPSCKDGGPHRYFARYDNVLDPRLSSEEIQDIFRSTISHHMSAVRAAYMAKIYVKDICDGCGDVIERLEGLNAMEVLAHQAKRIKG